MSQTQIIPVYRCQRHKVQYYIEGLPNLGSNDIELKMVEIPAGSFTMGAPETEAESLDSERPQHEVNISTFCIGKYPITQAQWRIVALTMLKTERELDPEPSEFKGDNLPVERVSWLDAVEFCKRLSVHTGREYRLPSEAEWEYACRAMPSPYRKEPPRFDGSSNFDGVHVSVGSAIGSAIVERKGQIYPPFHYGETITTALVNYDGNSSYGQAPKGEYREKTTPVESFLPNAFGLHDMHGNVWEWCADDWHTNYKGAPTDGRAWIDDNDNYSQEEVNKLLCGGSWVNNARVCRSAFRDSYDGRIRASNNGFRVVCVLQ